MRGYSIEGRAARAVLTEPDVRRIRQLAAQGKSTRALADAYGLTPEAIRRIVRYDTWRWVSEEGAGFVQAEARPEPSQKEIDAAKARFLAKLSGLIQNTAAQQMVGDALVPELKNAGGPSHVLANAQDGAQALPDARKGAYANSVPLLKPMPSMKESLRAAARESDEIAARVQAAAAARLAQEDALLAGLSGPNELPCGNPPTNPAESRTDEGSK